MDFNIPHRIRKFDDHNLAVLQLVLDYIQETLRRYPPKVTYSTDMDTDVAGNEGDIVYADTDDFYYICTAGGTVGNATWERLLTFQNYPRQVTYTVSMNNDVAGTTGEIAFATTDSKFYGCTSGGAAGSATWAAFH